MSTTRPRSNSSFSGEASKRGLKDKLKRKRARSRSGVGVRACNFRPAVQAAADVNSGSGYVHTGDLTAEQRRGPPWAVWFRVTMMANGCRDNHRALVVEGQASPGRGASSGGAAHGEATGICSERILCSARVFASTGEKTQRSRPLRARP